MRLLAILTVFLLGFTGAAAQAISAPYQSATCGVDVRWLNSNGSLNQPRSSETPAQLSFVVHVGKGDGCSSADVTVSATYLTDTQEFICSGTIRQAMNVTSPVQEFNIAIRPFTQLDFVRWRNQPGVRGEQIGKRLDCMNIDGTADVGDAERHKATWMRLSIGVMPNGGGLALTEALFRFQ